MNLTFLRTFVTLAREQGFTKTAKVLHMTQPGVSQHVAKLEDDFGVPLVDRDAASFQLTEAGRRLLEHGARLLEQEQNLKVLVVADDPHAGLCRFASPGAFGTRMYSFLLELNQRHRGLVIQYVYRPNPDTITAVLDDSIDVGFVTMEPGRAELACEVVDQERLALVVPRDVIVHGLDDLIRLGFVGHPDGAHHASRLLRANFPGFTGMDQLPLRAFNNQILRILEPVALGLGFTALPEVAVRAFPQQETIRTLPLAHEVVDPIYAVQRRGRILPRRFELIRAAFRQRFGAPEGALGAS